MNSDFINCNYCGTRNLAGDPVCAICKSKLISQESKTFTSKKSTFLIISVIIVGISFLYYNILRKDENTNEIDAITGNQEMQSNNSVNSYQSKQEYNFENSPEYQMSVINDKIKPPKKITITLFAKSLETLHKRFSNSTKQDLANIIVSGYNIIIKEGRNDTLIYFTNKFVSFSEKLDTSFNLSPEQSLALFVKSIYYQ